MPFLVRPPDAAREHRRGVILGLTVAEFMILITFLVLTCAVVGMDELRRNQATAVNVLGTQILNLQRENGVLRAKIPTSPL